MRTLAYDSSDRLVTAGTSSYGHNALGQRAWKETPGPLSPTATRYVYDLSGRLIAETTTKLLTVETVEHIRLDGLPLAFVGADGTIRPVLADHRGAPRTLLSGYGTPLGAPAAVWDAAYAPFGAAAVTVDEGFTDAFNLRFPGQYFDAETGLHYNYFRDYDASLGRYVESDPISLAGGWNTYAYVGGNPVMRVDPRGLVTGKIDVPNVNGSDVGCLVTYFSECVDGCRQQFQEDEQHRIEKFLNDEQECRFKMEGIATCLWGVVTFDYALERYNRRKLERCLESCRNA